MSDAGAADAASLPEGLTITFASVRLIERRGNGPWCDLRVFPL